MKQWIEKHRVSLLIILYISVPSVICSALSLFATSSATELLRRILPLWTLGTIPITLWIRAFPPETKNDL